MSSVEVFVIMMLLRRAPEVIPEGSDGGNFVW